MQQLPPPSRTAQEIVRRSLFWLIVGGLTVWFFNLVQSLLMPVFWAVVLAIVFAPLRRWLSARLPHREALVATITTIIIMLSVILPLTLVGIAVANQVSQLYARFSSGELDPNIVIDYVETQMPIARDFAAQYNIDFEQARQNVTAGVATLGQRLLNMFLGMGQNFLGIAAEFFLMLYFLWFFIKDGRDIVLNISRTFPLSRRDERVIIDRFAIVSRATLKGTSIVALAQGTLGGILFWAVGIDGAIFWGVVMTLLSLLPIGGAALVWAPAAIILAIQGDWTRAIIIAAVGSLAIGLIDNLLRPLLVSRDTKMPDYLVLIATLGGIGSFGLAGFVVGPVVAALFLTIWELVRRDYGEPLPDERVVDV